MIFEPTQIEGAWVVRPEIRNDSRGSFQEMYRLSEIQETLGRPVSAKQINQSISSRGVLRGIHFATNLGQAKFVWCPRGSVLDIIVDTRIGSRTFGAHEVNFVSEENGVGVLIERGLGHAFLSLENESTVTYLCDEYYSPDSELELSIFDESLGIKIETITSELGIENLVLSEKDKSAPSLQELQEKGLLPFYVPK